ncbi:MAG: cobalt ECF transporter T component CbiQ [Desulfobacterota bacterium]|nr:cobalt ECF transporter T component CbiQ [Thermodesulfobacteriota bacterium]MDW8001453.1 cobalt ECF transporter T component CbiQ [Deltaproteobacteria bacterium]
MHLEVFSEGDSFLHRMDPKVKIIVFSVFSILCAKSEGDATQLTYLIYASFLLFLAKIKFRLLITRLIGANLFLALVWIFFPLTYGGEKYLSFGPFLLSYEGIHKALSITFKCNAIVLATIGLLSTSSLFMLAHAMLKFKVPSKLVTLFFLFYRYLTVIHEEYSNVKRAVMCRGFVPKTNLLTYKTYAYMIGGMLHKSYERAEEIYKAMLCRGFKGNFPFSEDLPTKKNDVVFAGISVGIFVLLEVLS